MNKKGFTLIELMIVIAIIAIIAAIAIPGLLNSMRGANERNASGTLKSVATAEVDYRSNDRDNDTVNNFWVADVRGLYAIAGDGTNPIALIEQPVARADGNSVGAYGGDSTTAAWVWNLATDSPKAGYWYASVTNYEQDDAGAQAAYNADGNDHNNSRFGFIAYPDDYGSSGSNVFVIGNQNTVWKKEAGIYGLTAGQGQQAGAPAATEAMRFDPINNGWGPID